MEFDVVWNLKFAAIRFDTQHGGSPSAGRAGSVSSHNVAADTKVTNESFYIKKCVHSQGPRIQEDLFLFRV
jgi:hypothetical protein